MPNRKTKCLKPKELMKSFAHERVWLKSEDIPEDLYLSYYVDLGYIASLDNNSNHLISGRRGTGKTHLLGAFRQHINTTKKNEIAIKVSIMELAAQETSIPAGVSDEVASYIAARNKFNQLLKLFFDRFLPLINHQKPTISKAKHNRLDNLLQELLEEIEVGSYFHEDVRNELVESDVGLSLSGEFIPKPGQMASPQAQLVPKIESKSEEGKDISATFRGSINHQQVRKLIFDILEISEIEILHLLIDEWMELDKNTPSQIQNHFAQFLKRVFFNHRHVSVVIASIWNQTSLYQREAMEISSGIQIGQDIEHSVDLDTSFFESEDEIFDFCKNILFRRLAEKEEGLADFKDTKGNISDAFLTDIFDTLDNFRCFIAASHGIPRDIMKIIQKSGHKIKHRFDECAINLDVINSVASSIYRREKRETIQQGSSTKAMWSKINDYMYKTGDRLFLIKDGAQSTSRAFRSLIDHELVHEISNITLPRWVRSEYRAYFIDYGNFVDWIKTKKYSLKELVTEGILPSWKHREEVNVSNMLIDVLPDRDIYVKCLSCDYEQLRTLPVVVKHGLCVQCGDKIKEAV